MLLIFTHKTTPRITYVFKQICLRMLGMPVSFTTKIEEFVAHDGPKLSYTHKQLGNELHLKSSELLFEQGITDVEIKVADWDSCPGFFTTSETSFLPYDIFAATFYLLSRYEEYLPHVKDPLGRYPHTESIAYTNGFLMRPVVDIWAQRLQTALVESFPNATFKNRIPEVEVVIKVQQAFAYRKLGFLRTFIGFFEDFFKFRLKRNFNRIRVLLGLRKDPYDTFNWLINVQKQAKTPFRFFFELGDYSEQSKNIKHSKITFQSLIKMVGDYSEVGLLVSELATRSLEQLKLEKYRLEHIVNRSLNNIVVGNHNFILPETQRNAIDQEVRCDYTMGYANALGFRAGTCTSFLFYDLDYEIQTPLLMKPVCANDTLLVDEKRGTIDMIRYKQLRKNAAEVGGIFIMEFSNTSFMFSKAKRLFKTTVIDEIN